MDHMSEPDRAGAVDDRGEVRFAGLNADTYFLLGYIEGLRAPGDRADRPLARRGDLEGRAGGPLGVGRGQVGGRGGRRAADGAGRLSPRGAVPRWVFFQASRRRSPSIACTDAAQAARRKDGPLYPRAAPGRAG